MKVTFLEGMDRALRDSLGSLLDIWAKEVAGLLRDVEQPVGVRFDNSVLIPETGTGGFADEGNMLTLAFDLDYQDKAAQLKNLRASYFHESYHVGQGWVGDMVLEPLPESVLEGAATVFERDRAGSSPGWALYGDEAKMRNLYENVRALKAGYDVGRWKFYNPELNEKWVMYRVGTYIIDQVLKGHKKLNIESLVAESPEDILLLSGLN